jgi:acyl dehydratase
LDCRATDARPFTGRDSLRGIIAALRGKMLRRAHRLPHRNNMDTVGLGIPFEDLPVGRKFKTVGRTITEPDLVNFVNTTGMTEVLFTNYEFLKNESPIKGRLVPGACVFSMSEGLLTQSTMQHTGFAFLNMELNIEGPTFVGDTIHVECEVVESRPSASRPGLGIVRTRNKVVKQDGKVVMVYTPLRMVKGKTWKPA